MTELNLNPHSCPLASTETGEKLHNVKVVDKSKIKPQGRTQTPNRQREAA